MAKRTGKSSFEKIDRTLSRRAARLIAAKVPVKHREMLELKFFLSGDVNKKIAEIRKELQEVCTHMLLLEIPRRRIEASPGRSTRIYPPTRVCLICGDMEYAVQRRTRRLLRAVFSKLTAKPIGVVRKSYGAITIGIDSRDGRPLTDFVKATLASGHSNSEALINKIMYPNMYR